MRRKIIIIKIGSSVLMTKRNKLDEFRISHIADQILALKKKGFAVILVVSGAVACGLITYTGDRLHMLSKEDFGLLKQAASGIGQVQLITIFDNIFKQKQMAIAQILLNKCDLKDDTKREGIKKILEFYFQSGIIPVFNENDVVDLNSFGGNDFLAAELTLLLSAQQLIILSTSGGSTYGVGGGKTKKKVNDLLTSKNIDIVITDGRIKNIILKQTL
ncbi:hypothetical protein HZB96_04505 [Candidatus Gottesmanbacteria bacterium]|nr:hypothetical protein [Candidatus Gottesmanbacteria bacterium]